MQPEEFEEHVCNVLKNTICSNSTNSNTINSNILTEKIAVAVSGGSDSLALVISISRIFPNVLAIMVNHNLRPTATKEIAQTAATLEKFGIKYVIKEWDGNVKKNLENDARNARYKLLIDTCKAQKIKYLCIGHRANDQVETFFLNLARGSGLDGLCAMPVVKMVENVAIVRPMLGLTKEDCRSYLRALHVDWCEDESNKDRHYKRNNIRFLLEQIEDKNLILQRTNQTIKTLQEAKLALDELVNITINSITINRIISQDKHEISFSRNAFMHISPYIQKSMLTRCIMKLSGRTYKLRLYQIENVVESIKSSGNFKRTLAGCVVEMRGDLVKICSILP